MIWKIPSLSRLPQSLKFGNSLLGKCTLERVPKVLTGQSLVLEGLGMWFKDALNHLSRKQDWRWDYPWNICGGPFCLMAWMQGGPTRFLKILYQQKQCQLDWKGKAGWNVRRLLGFQNSIGKNQAYKTTQVQLCMNLKEKGKNDSKGRVSSHRVFQALPYLALLDFEMTWAKWLTPLPSIFSLL